MNNLIDKKSNQMKISTHSAIMEVKYSLKAEQKASLQRYHLKNTWRDPVYRSLMYNMRIARARYVKRMEENMKKKQKIKRSTSATLI